MDDRLGTTRPGRRRGHRRRPVAPARAAGSSGWSPGRCSARCCSARSRSSTTRPPRSRPGSASRSSRCILPSVAAVACLGAIRLVPFGLWLLPALGVTWLIVGRTLVLESRINRGQGGLSAEDRTAVLVTILLVALPRVHRGRRDGPGRPRPARRRAARRTTSLVLAAGDALVAGLLGYRAAAAAGRTTSRDVAVVGR